jgi:phage tail-like protein
MATGSEIRAKHRFHVFSDDTNQGGSEGLVELGSFKTVTGLELETEVTEWKTGDMAAMIKLPGFTKYPGISISKGFDDDTKLKEWYDLVWDSSEGKGAKEYRKDLIIKILNRDGTSFKIIRAINAWPSKYNADDLDGASSDPWVESIEVQHNGWRYEPIT